MNTLITLRPLTPQPAAAQGVGLVARIGAAVWKWLEEVGRARARRDLMALAARCETNQPELAKELRAACYYLA